MVWQCLWKTRHDPLCSEPGSVQGRLASLSSFLCPCDANSSALHDYAGHLASQGSVILFQSEPVKQWNTSQDSSLKRSQSNSVKQRNPLYQMTAYWNHPDQIKWNTDMPQKTINLKQNEAQSARAESTQKGVSARNTYQNYHACQVRVTVGDSDLCCSSYVTYFER